MFARLQRHYPQLRFIDPNQALCLGDVCRNVIDGVTVYRDAGHLSETGSRLLCRLLKERGVSITGAKDSVLVQRQTEVLLN